MSETVHLAVNGTLMRGLELNHNLIDAGAQFVEETATDPHYQLYSIKDIHPAMIRNQERGASITLEVWDVPSEGLVSILKKEPEGLCIGKVTLNDGRVVLGVLGEPHLCKEMKEITEYGGWRDYTQS